MAATQAVPPVNVQSPLLKIMSIAGEEGSTRMIAGSEFEVDSFVRSLRLLQAFLRDAEQMSVSSEGMRVWLKEVDRLTSTADDLVDELAYEVRRLKLDQEKKKRNKLRNCFSPSNSLLATKRKLSRGFASINSSFKSLFREMDAFGFQMLALDARAQFEQIRRTTYSSVVESQMFETGYDVPRLKEILLKEAENDGDLFFVSIVGRGGIGKTTLAQVLYKDADVVNHFDERMWVVVSDNFKIGKILKDMFESLTRSVLDLSSSSREAILLKLLERLKGKKFLLVLDDVWNHDVHLWDSFITCLLKLGGSRGSKIMVTTRGALVAELLKPGLSYEMSFQPDEYSWKLFQQIAFAPGGPEMTPVLEGVGRKLVNNCGGDPLAIKALGGLLYTMRDEDDWVRIERNDIWHSSPPLSAALRLSYDHLPSKFLKLCFLYCSIFPKGSVMEKDELIQLWMAQGLLNPPHGFDLSMEDLGAEYLDILAQTSFLQKAEQDVFDRGNTYKMHDLLHGFALSLSKDYCSIMEGMNIGGNVSQPVHLSLINCEAKILGSFTDNIRKLRTLRWENSRVLGDMLEYTPSLRVLIVVDRLLEELPESVGNLKLLYYLDISKTKIQKLPDSISKLYNLQTLKLYDLIELPKNFEHLENLRHLYIESFKDLDKLTALPPRFQELINPSSLKASFKAYLHKNCPIEKLDMLLEHPDRYSSLRIYRLENVSDYEEATKAKISSMSTIDRLQLHWNARRENSYDEDVLEGLQPHSNIKHLIIQNYKGSAFPAWMANTTQPLILLHLVKIELEDCSCCEQVPPLGHLPSLKIVKILGIVNVKNIGAEFYGLTNLNDQSSSSSSGWGAPALFPALRELTIGEMTCLQNWSEPVYLSNYSSSVCPLLEKFEVEQCPKLIRLPNIINSSHRHLRRLEIALCDSLACLPEGLGRLQSLEDLDIRGLPSLSQLSIGCCDNLKSLTIGGFSSASKVDYNTQHAIGSKTSLHLKGDCGQLTSLPEELQYLSALRYLTISGYGGLESLPEWFCKLQSLQILKLEFCWKLMYLPAAGIMQQLTNLDELDICYCPLLEARCTKGSRPEWYKISHIPRIKINSEEIKFHRRNRN